MKLFIICCRLIHYIVRSKERKEEGVEGVEGAVGSFSLGFRPCRPTTWGFKIVQYSTVKYNNILWNRNIYYVRFSVKYRQCHNWLDNTNHMYRYPLCFKNTRSQLYKKIRKKMGGGNFERFRNFYSKKSFFEKART